MKYFSKREFSGIFLWRRNFASSKREFPVASAVPRQRRKFTKKNNSSINSQEFQAEFHKFSSRDLSPEIHHTRIP